IVQVGPHDFATGLYSGGAFNLDDYLGWSDMVTHQEQVSRLGGLWRTATAARRQAPALATLPLAEAADALCAGRATWFREWVTHRSPSDRFWGRYRLREALDRVQVPVLLQ